MVNIKTAPMNPEFAYMKYSTATARLFAALVAAGLAMPSAKAAFQFYDVSNATGLTPGDATWNTGSISAWAASSAPGTTNPSVWVNGNDAFFKNGGSNIVTLGGDVTANSLTQDKTNTTLLTTITTINAGAGTKITLTSGNITNAGNAAFTINPDIVLGATGTILATDAINLAGVVSGTGFGFNKTGVGTLTLSNANTYSGTTTLTTGTLAVGNKNALGAGTLRLSGGSLQATSALTGANALANTVTLTANSTIGGSADLELAGVFTNSGASNTLTVNNTGLTTISGAVNISESAVARSLSLSGTGNITISGAIANNAATNLPASNLNYTGSGILSLAGTNSFGGTLFVTGGGTLSVTNLGTALGGIPAGAGLHLGSTSGTGRLRYTGSGETFLKQIVIGTGAGDSTGVIDQSGATGQLTLSSGGITSRFTGNKTLILQGSTAGTGLVTTTISNGAADILSLTKQGTGTWTLSGTNTYTGGTTVNGGTLNLSGSLASTTIAVGNGATFNYSKPGTNVLSKNFTLNEGASLLGSVGTNSFASSGTTTVAADLTSGSFTAITLGAFVKSGILNFNLTNIEAGTYSLFAGTTPTGAFTSVTGTGFNVVSAFAGTVGAFEYSFANVGNTLTITSAVPEPATYATLAGLGILGFAVYRRRRVLCLR